MRGLTARCATRYSVKNCCTSAGNDGGFGAVALRMGHLRLPNNDSKRPAAIAINSGTADRYQYVLVTIACPT